MGKKNNKPAPQTEEQQNVNNAQQPAVQVIQAGDFMNQLNPANISGSKSLSPDSMATVLNLLDKKFGGDPESAAAKYHMSIESVKTLDIVATHSLVALFATAIVEGNDSVAINVKRVCLPAIEKVASDMGIVLGNPLLLAPVKEGETNDEDVVQIKGDETKINAEAKKQIKADAKIASEDVELDPTKLDKEGAIKAMEHLFVKTVGGYQKFKAVTTFLRSWLEVQNKDNKDELEKIKNYTEFELLEIVKKHLTRPSFVINSMGNHMAIQTALHKSPIFAYCMFRNSSKNKTTGVTEISDQDVADYTRFIILWSLEIKIADNNKLIETKKSDIAELSKTEKAKKQNAKGIESLEEEIKKLEEKNNHHQETIDVVMNPSSNVPDNLIEEFKAHDKFANNIVKMIWQSYYPGIEMKDVAVEVVYNNVQQHAGIITSMFREAGSPLQNYSESNLMRVEISTETEEEKPEEKN